MNSLRKTAFRDLNQMTIDVAEKFFFAKRMCESKREHLLVGCLPNENDPFDYYLLKVQAAYDSLTDLQKNLINNEFFHQNYNQWWKPLYSKATFYRYKKEAMQKFLGAMYDL